MNYYKLKINYLPELKKLLTGRNVPAMVSVNVTNSCNQNCIYCEIGQKWDHKDAQMITKENLFRVIDDMAKHGINRLSLCGGEPFLLPDLLEVVLYAREHHVFCNITSNGMTIHKLNRNELHLLKVCGTIINISIDSFQSPIQSETRGNKQALENALLSIEALQKFQIPVHLLCAISKFNYKDLFTSLCKANDRNIQSVLYQPIISFSNFPGQDPIAQKGELNVAVDDINTLMEELKLMFEFEKQNPVKTNLYRIIPWIADYLKQFQDPEHKPFYIRSLSRFYCRESEEVIDIGFHGGLQPCGLLAPTLYLKDDPDEDLLVMWRRATRSLKEQLKQELYPLECSGCCHKFGRNMLASVMKYPLQNRNMLFKVFPLLWTREWNHLYLKYSKS
ncbi:MAG: radical SAM protein [Bacteroidales bacterium]|jgi:MoaA/NifB/PqqE/SkfB family radical SAM enzyme|nr:radical SAM protein [Bacteroidales bacterium]